MKLNVGVKIRNVFNIQIRDAATEEVKESYQAFNTVTQDLLKILTGGGSFLPHITFGTGTGAPSIMDVKLFTYLGTKAATIVTTTHELPVLSITKTIRLGASEFIGSNITEVGFGSGSSTTGLQTHAMIVDSEGAPISITKTATDIIDIYATLYYEVLEPSGDLAGAAYWRRFAAAINGNKPTPYNIINNSWNAAVETHPEYPIDGIDSGPWGLKVGLAKNMTLTTDLVNMKRKYNVRFTELEANDKIKGLTFNAILTVDVSKIPAIWAGKTYTNSTVGTGDGVTTKFNLKKGDIKNLSVMLDGVVVPPESYTYSPKIKADFVGTQVGFSELPELADKSIYYITRNPVNESLYIFYCWTNATVYSVEVDAVLMKATILDRKVVFPERPIPSSGTYDIYYGDLSFIAGGEAVNFAMPGYADPLYKIFSYDPATGLFGVDWTKHPNMPSPVATTPPAQHENAMSVRDIPGSSFAFGRVLKPSGNLPVPANEKLYSFSLNKVTKVYGENVNRMNIAPLSSVLWMAVNPVYNVLMAIEEWGNYYYYSIYPFEKSTGILGASNGDRLTYDTSTGYASLPVWSPDGLSMYVIRGDHAQRSQSSIMLRYDPATGKLLQDGTWTSNNPLLVPDAGPQVYLPNGDLILSDGNTGVIYHGKITGNTSILYGTYPAGSWALANGTIVTIRTAVNAGIPFASFAPLQIIGDAHLSFVSPPANGAAIKATFLAPYIPKDTDHILDLEVVYSFMGG